MQIPKLDKIVINVGAGEAKENPKAIDAIMTDLTKITGQQPDGLQGEEEPSRTSSSAKA